MLNIKQACLNTKKKTVYEQINDWFGENLHELNFLPFFTVEHIYIKTKSIAQSLFCDVAFNYQF